MVYVMLVGAYPFERPEDKHDNQKLQKMIQAHSPACLVLPLSMIAPRGACPMAAPPAPYLNLCLSSQQKSCCMPLAMRLTSMLLSTNAFSCLRSGADLGP